MRSNDNRTHNDAFMMVCHAGGLSVVLGQGPRYVSIAEGGLPVLTGWFDNHSVALTVVPMVATVNREAITAEQFTRLSEYCAHYSIRVNCIDGQAWDNSLEATAG